MNARQRRHARRHRRTAPVPQGCYRQGHSGTTSYPDLMCTDGYMSDMDDDGHDPSVARQPCPACNPAEHAEWMRERAEEELPEGVERNGELRATCRSCDQDYTLYCEVDEFSPDMSYCGGSLRCIP